MSGPVWLTRMHSNITPIPSGIWNEVSGSNKTPLLNLYLPQSLKEPFAVSLDLTASYTMSPKIPYSLPLECGYNIFSSSDFVFHHIHLFLPVGSINYGVTMLV